MDKKYQVFISSSYKDLKTARKRVSDTILSMGHFPVGMEMFGARDDEQWKIIQETIDQSDYYVVIVGRCFGSQVPGEDISYTQKEFRYARDKGIPILAFIADEDADIAITYQDTEPEKIVKLNAFKRELETGRTVDYWTNYDNLATKVAVSLPKEIASHPMPGWVRVEDDSDTKDSSKKPDGKEKPRRYSETERKLKDRLIDYSWVKTNEDRRILGLEPWRKIKANNLILRDNQIENPNHGNGLIKVEPYDFYDDGILVFSPRGGARISVRMSAGGQARETDIDSYIVDAIPYSRIKYFDERGSENDPYPTLYCDFVDGVPFAEQWYIDKKTGIRYTEDQIIDKDSEGIFDDKVEYVPTPVTSSDRSKISLYSCIMALFASVDDGRIMVIPSLLSTEYIAGGRNLERNQTPRELARWDGAVSQLLGQGYIKLIGKKDLIYSLTEDGFNLADRFKDQCNVDPKKSSAQILSDFGAPKE